MSRLLQSLVLIAIAAASAGSLAWSQYVSREVTANAPAGGAGGSAIEQVVSRELTVQSSAGPAVATSFVSRELTILSPGGAPTALGVVSREISVLSPGGGAPATPTVISRELTVLAPGGAAEPLSVVSREISVGAELGLSLPPVIVSREMTVLTPGTTQLRQIASREVSVSTPIPDLAIRNAMGPAVAVAASTVGLTWETDNIGLGVANAPWIDRIYLSTDDVFDGADTFLQLDACSATLTPQAPALQCSASVPLPNLIGSYYLIVVIDADSNVFEVDETEGNNIAAIPIELTPIPIADLTVTAVNPPASATDGQPTTVSWTEANVGTLDAVGTWGAKIEYSLSPTGSSPVFLTEIPQPGPLAQGASTNRLALVTVPAGLSGDIWFIVTTDSQGAIPEQSEGNNKRVAAAPTFVNQPNKPDLQVASITPPAGTIYVDNAYSFAYRVENRDDNGSANGAWADRVYLSLADANPDPGEAFATVSNSLQLAPCPSGSGCPGYSRTFQMPAQAQPGSYWIIVETDVNGTLEEANDGNNILAIPITVQTATYRATISAAIDQGLSSTPAAPVSILFTGQALDLSTGQPVPNVPVTVRVRNKGTRRVYDTSAPNQPIVTNASGQYSFPFQPLDYEAGIFKIVRCNEIPSALT